MIIQNNEDLLRTPCTPVCESEIADLISKLEYELEYSNKIGSPGIGLAAIQIGIPKSVAIVRSNNININLVNCHISSAFDQAIFKDEGCLSFPGRVENTLRFQEVHVEGNAVYPYRFVATGLSAIVCQHEIDHMNSKIFLDNLSLKQKKKIGPNDICPC